MRLNDGRFVLDLDGIDAAFRGGARTMILCNPYNPLGRNFSRSELHALAEVVERHGARVVAELPLLGPAAGRPRDIRPRPPLSFEQRASW